MAINFPDAPTLNQQFLAAGVTYFWNGYGWVAKAGDLTGFVAKSGDTMSGLLYLSAAPTVPLGAATKQYVDNALSGISLSGYVLKSGDTMTGALTLAGNPTTNLQAATKQYVDSVVSGTTLFVKKAGDVMTGTLQIANNGPTLQLNRQTAAQSCGVAGLTGGTQYWFLEYGAAADSSFTLHQYNDNGTYRGSPWRTSRADMSMYFNYYVQCTQGASFDGGNMGAWPSGNRRYLTWASNVQIFYDYSTGDLTFWNNSHHMTLENSNSVVGFASRIKLHNGNPIISLWPGYNNAFGIWSSGGTDLHLGATDGAGNVAANIASVGYGSFYLWGTCRGYQPGGGMWNDNSDVRIKNVLGDFDHGLAAVKTLNPKRYTFKGNDTRSEPENVKKLDENKIVIQATDTDPVTVPYGNSPHHGVAVSGKEFIGLIAQDVEVLFPELVTKKEGFIDGQPVTDLRDLDPTPLIYALVNAVKELSARIEALEAETP